MLFSKLSAVLVGFASIASASPVAYNALAAREASAAERGLIWAPRNAIQKRTGRDIVIVQQKNIQLTQIQIVQEVQIVNVIKNIIVVDGRNEARDNIRRNHYRNRNRNRDVNIIVIVVVVVEDNRDNNRRNRRYVTRHVESNPRAVSREWVVVSEQSTLTVNAVAPTASAGFNEASIPPPVVGTWDPEAPLDPATPDTLLPASIEAPSWSSQARSDRDPAIIIEDNQLVFVSFDDDDSSINCNINFDDNNRDRKDDNNRNDDKDDNKKDDDKKDDNKDDKKDDNKGYR